jgi:adenylosuccinate lyase
MTAPPQDQPGKLSGAVGTFAHLEPEIEERVCFLGLKPANVSTQIIQRDRYSEFVTTLAIIASSIEKFALRFATGSEQRCARLTNTSSPVKGLVGDAPQAEPDSLGTSLGLSRVLRGYAVAALENNAPGTNAIFHIRLPSGWCCRTRASSPTICSSRLLT